MGHYFTPTFERFCWQTPQVFYEFPYHRMDFRCHPSMYLSPGEDWVDQGACMILLYLCFVIEFIYVYISSTDATFFV